MIYFPDDLFEVLIYIDGSESYDRPSAPMDNLAVIREAIKLCGFRFVLRSPEIKEDDADEDMVKQWDILRAIFSSFKFGESYYSV